MTKEKLFSIKTDKPDEAVREKAKAKWDALAKPIDGLGDLEDVICRIVSACRKADSVTGKKVLIIMCADNGVVSEGISQTGKEVTNEVAALMGENKSSVGIMTKDYPIDIMTIDIGIDSDETPEGVINKKIRKGTRNFLKEPAMTHDEVLAAIKAGIDSVKECRSNGAGLIATGEMGIGNTTTSSALMSVLTGLDAKECTGRGAGLSDAGLDRKIRVIEDGIALHFGKTDHRGFVSKVDVLNALCCIGGLDIAGLCGVFIGGAMYHIPIVIDGFISSVSALTAERLVPGCKDYMIASHMGKEKGMKIILDELGLKPVIDAHLALGEGTGAVMMLPMLDMAFNLYNSGTLFDDTSIEQYERFGGK